MTASVGKIAKIRTGTRTESSFCRSSASFQILLETCEEDLQGVDIERQVQ